MTRRYLCCLPIFSYIKPQLIISSSRILRVVYLSFPTSNHNIARWISNPSPVVYLSFPTSNHNLFGVAKVSKMLFTYLFLHQTTTTRLYRHILRLLFTYLFLHQTTTKPITGMNRQSCLPIFSYIKPQHANNRPCCPVSCLPIFSYIKPQPVSASVRRPSVVYLSFPTSNHNTDDVTKRPFTVVYLSFPTSNHNLDALVDVTHVLFTYLFLHQTTTVD